MMENVLGSTVLLIGDGFESGGKFVWAGGAYGRIDAVSWSKNSSVKIYEARTKLKGKQKVVYGYYTPECDVYGMPKLNVIGTFDYE